MVNMSDAPMVCTSESMYVIAHEPGAEHPALPTWASNTENPAGLEEVCQPVVTKQMVAEVPGAFQLHNVLSEAETSRLIALTESLGYLPDAPVSLGRDIRHNDNLTWVVDELTDALIWQRVQDCFDDLGDVYLGRRALGLNARFRFYRYQTGDFFKPHTDGSWPGSRVIDGELVTNAYADRWSQISFLIFLNDDFSGGATQFWVDASNPELPARNQSNVRKVDVRTPAGGVLCFPHGQHPLHCLHSSEPIEQGRKYIIRTDVLFEL